MSELKFGDLQSGLIRTAIHLALEHWSNASTLTFREEYFTDDVNIRISFQRGNHGDRYAFDGRGLVLAHAFFPTHKSDLHLDVDEEWNFDFLLRVMIHELGHSLGLSHSGVREATMYPWYKEDGPIGLDVDDINGIQYIYGLKSKWAKIIPYTPTTTRPKVHKRVWFNLKNLNISSINIVNSNIKKVMVINNHKS